MSGVYQEKASIWWFVLGFIGPVGLVLWLIKRNDGSDKTKKLFCGLISFAVAAVFIGILVGLYFLNLDPVFIHGVEKEATALLK